MTIIGKIQTFAKMMPVIERAFKILSGRIGIVYGRIRDLYYDAEKNLINKPFAVSPISKSIDEYKSTDLVEYTFTFFKEGLEDRLIEKTKAIMTQIG